MNSKPGSQIDLLIDRRDGVINICEAKYTMSPYEIDVKYEGELRTKIETFAKEASCKKALHLTMISAGGLVPNNHVGIVQNEITGEELFL